MKKTISIIIFTACLVFTNCSKKDPLGVLDSLEAIECANKLSKIVDDDSDDCTELLKLINELENSCSSFLSDENKKSIAELRASCEAN
ncbi:hypothetical protein CLV91_3349 [Maribacter vaceletii]|uniref:Uncharacterized protein n=1 Tax=Maribacter vaceletii TaxID=1206816 RepID=A0A495DRX6_9FLAO|nr:hypothetical protein [Maribacter vaceletii]RKR06494.1 hypothetical protein CLV91_3349 [Maribacter vaceletii]